MKDLKQIKTKLLCFYKGKHGILVINEKLLEFHFDGNVTAKLPTKSIAFMEYESLPDTTHLNFTIEHKHKKKKFVFTFNHAFYTSEYESFPLNDRPPIPIDEAFSNAVFNSLNPDTANKESAQISANSAVLAYSFLKYLQRKKASNIHALLIESEHKRKEYSFFKLILEEFCLKNQIVSEDVLMDKFNWIKWLLSLDYTSIDDSKTLTFNISELLNNDNTNNFIFDVARNKERFRKYKYLEETKQISNIGEFKEKEKDVNLNDMKEKEEGKIKEFLKGKDKDTVLDYMLNKSFVLPSRDIELENVNVNIDFDAINRLYIIKHDLISSKKNCNGNNVKFENEKVEIKWNDGKESYNYDIEEDSDETDEYIMEYDNKEKGKVENKTYKEMLIELGKVWINN